jgi:hypothetical protein
LAERRSTLTVPTWRGRAVTKESVFHYATNNGTGSTMASLLIGYDRNKNEKSEDYKRLIDAIKRNP